MTVVIYPKGWPAVRTIDEDTPSRSAGFDRVKALRGAGVRAELLDADGSTVSTGCGCTCIPECVTQAEHDRGNVDECTCGHCAECFAARRAYLCGQESPSNAGSDPK